MATTNKNLLARKANRVNPKTVKVGDMVKWGRTVGVVVSVSKWSRIHGVGSILWGGDVEPTESTMGVWNTLQKA